MHNFVYVHSKFIYSVIIYSCKDGGSLVHTWLIPNGFLISPSDSLICKEWCWFQQPRGLSHRAWPLGYWDHGFESSSRHGCLFLCLYVVLSCVGRGLCDELITRLKKSYHVSNKIRETSNIRSWLDPDRKNDTEVYHMNADLTDTYFEFVDTFLDTAGTQLTLLSEMTHLPTINLTH
jgi:hypothetical protein